jgi:predicted HTH transcriptional regulator
MNSSEIEERLLELLAEGEGPTVEFKSSFRYDFKASRVNKELTKAVVKTLAAFLNSRGGTLLIGIDDVDKSLRQQDARVRSGRDDLVRVAVVSLPHSVR